MHVDMKKVGRARHKNHNSIFKIVLKTFLYTLRLWTLVELCNKILSQQFMWLGPAALLTSPSMWKI